MNESAEQLKARFQLRELQVLEAEPQVLTARFSPCGKFLLAGGFDARLRRWNVDDSEMPELPELPALDGHGGWVQALAFGSADATLYSGDSWGTLLARGYAEAKPAVRWKREAAHDGWIRDLAVSPGGELLASCGMDRKLRTWNPGDGKPGLEIDAEDDVYRLLFHPGEPFLISGDQHGTIKQWDLEAGRCVRELDAGGLFEYHRIQEVGGVRALACSPDGRWLVAGGTRPKNGGNVTGIPTLLFFDWETGKLEYQRELGATNDVYVCDVAWHEEQFVMAVTSGTPGAGKIVFQRPADEEPFFVHAQLANCHSLSRTADGRRLAVTATNRGSNGNGRRLNDAGEYEGNTTPIHLFELGAEDARAG